MVSIGIVLAILGMFILSLSKLTARKVMSSSRVLTAAVYIHLLMAGTVGILTLLFGSFALPPNIPYYLLTVAIGAMAIVPLYMAYQQHGLGLPTAIASAFVPITVLLSVLFYGERFSWIAWIGMALVLIGVFLASTNLRNWRKPKIHAGLKWAFVTMVGWGIFFFLIKRLITEMGTWPASFALEGGIAILVVLFALVRGAIAPLPRKILGWTLATGILDGVGVLCYYASLQFITASIAATILQVSVVVCAVLAALFLKERFTAVQKVAILVTFVGLVLVTV